MSTVVQATCPGCKKTLRIPAEWLQQAMRCKHCGVVIQARSSAPAAAATGVIPEARRPRRAPEVVPPPTATAVAATSTAPAPVARPVPLATPVATPVAPAGAAFADIEVPAGGASRRGRRRSSGSSGWKGLVVVLCVLAIGGGATAALWPKLAPLFQHDKKDPSKTSEPKKDGSKPTTPRDDKPATTDKAPDKPDDKPTPAKDKDKPSTTPKDNTPSDKTPAKDKPPDKPMPEKDRKPADKPSTDVAVTPPKDRPAGTDPKPTATAFPRRALLVSVHNYLYANPTNPGGPIASQRSVTSILGRFSGAALKVPPTQVAHLSDMAKQPTPPLKPVIEETVKQFLAGSRLQDRVLLLFVGHAVEVKGEAYFVPVEGELGNPDTLIPIPWLYEQLASCKARQKVLVLDVCRLDPARGLERPGSSPMDGKLDELLQKPPKGVRVWTACSTKQQSYEFQGFNSGSALSNGLFMDALQGALDQSIDGKIQRPDDLFPLEKLRDLVNQKMKAELDPLKLAQESRLAGSDPEEGAAYDPNEPMPPTPTAAKPPAPAGGLAETRIVRKILDDISTPPIKKGFDDGGLKLASMPAFTSKALDQYPDDKSDETLRKAVKKAQALLWAVSPQKEPLELETEVNAIRQELGKDLSILKESYRAPADENRFKTQILNDEKQVATILRYLKEGLEELEKKEIMEAREQAPKRWQASYDYMRARLMEQIAYVFEYQSLLGAMRKAIPERDAKVHGGWRMASQEKLQGDKEGRDRAKQAQAILDKLAEAHKGTPWEVVAKRERLTALGLDWKPEK